jgi:hypothetical protein
MFRVQHLFALSLPLFSLVGCQVDVIDGQADEEPTTPFDGSFEAADDSRAIYRSAWGGPADYSTASVSGSLGAGDLTVLMIVDRSGSMGEPCDGSTKWQIARSSLDAAIVGVEDQVTIGALFFPMEEECEVVPFQDPRHIQFQKGALFQQELDEVSDELGGGTPMYAAFLRANQAIEQAAMDGALEQRMRVVVVTDGEPNCSGMEDELVFMADTWREIGVDVRVMGLPGSQYASQLLDRIAGKEVSETDPHVPPPTVVDTTVDAQESGYVAPTDSDDVDDSLYVIVR